MEYRCIFAGFGGQGIISLGTLVAYAAMLDGKQVTFFPSYGIAMRGGTANCTVVVSDGEIASPIVSKPNVVAAMNELSLDYFLPMVEPGGIMLVNSSLVSREVERKDVRGRYLNATGIATENGDVRMANMAMLGGLIEVVKVVSLPAVEKAMELTFSGKLRKLIDKNLEVMRIAAGLVK